MNISYIKLPTQQIIKSPITALRFEDQIGTILDWSKNRESRSVCVANVHMVMEAYWNEAFGAILNHADMVTPDGMPLVWMMRQMGVSEQDRVAGMDILQSLCQKASEQNVSVLFLGSHSAILDRMKERLDQEFPTLQVAGLKPLPFRPLTQEEDDILIQEINASGAGIVFVSLGCPKQERFMAEHRDKINAVMIGVGAVFPLYAGIHRRAPQWIRESGLEWLYRLIQEPGRLWKRYTQTIPPFIGLALGQLFFQVQVPQWKAWVNNLLTTFIAWLNTFVSEPTPSANIVSFPQKKHRRIGQMLTEAGLLSPEQVKQILNAQQQQPHLKFGEIQAQWGWVKQETVDFFVEHLPHLPLQEEKKPLGHYLKSAALLDDHQIETILTHQKQTGHRFGEVAVNHGWVKKETIDLLMQHLSQQTTLIHCA